LLRELIDGIDAPIYRTASGNPVVFSDGAAANVKDLRVTITPTQSGSGEPYPPGGGKNLLPLTLANMKACATGGTWNGNAFATNGVTFSVILDDGGNVTGIAANGTATSGVYFRIISDGLPLTPGSSYILSGCPDGGNGASYFIYTGTYNANGWIDDDAHKSAREYNSDWTNLYISIRANVTVNNLVFRPMIRPASDADPTFAPYSNIRPVVGVSSATVTRTGENGANPQSVTVALTDGENPLTVYGGTLDVTTGELSVTWVKASATKQWILQDILDDSGAIPFYKHGNNNWPDYRYISADTARSEQKCNIAKIANPYNREEAANYGDYIAIMMSDDGTSEPKKPQMRISKAVVDAMPNDTDTVEITYPIVTPVTYQLTPAQLATLSGYNSVTTDAGTVSITYRADVALSMEDFA